MPKVDLPAQPPRSGVKLGTALIGAAVALVLVGVPLAGWLYLRHQADVFSLSLELKTPQGRRDIRVLGTEITLEERARKEEPVSNNCGLGLLDFYAFSKLARSTLDPREPQKKPVAGTYVLSFGDDDPQDGNGQVDPQQAAVISEFLVKRATGCFSRSEKL